MICEKCGKYNDEKNVYCKECGALLRDDTDILQNFSSGCNSEGGQEGVETGGVQREVESKNNQEEAQRVKAWHEIIFTTGNIVLVVIVIAIVAILIRMLFFVGNKDNNEETADADTSTTYSSSTVTPTPTVMPEPTEKPTPAAAPVTVTVSDEKPYDFYSHKHLWPESAKASSELHQDPEANNGIVYINSPDMVLDGDIITSWQEGAEGYGIGESLTLSFDSAEEVQYLELYLGNWRAQDVWGRNTTPTRLRLITDDDEFEIDFSPLQTVKYVSFSDTISTENLKFVIDEVRTGREQDCCISEIVVYGP